MASGRPSSLRTRPATAAWLAAVSSNVPEAAAARSVNSETASFWRSWARDSAAPGPGNPSGGTGTTYSPGTESGSRLVAITRMPGAARIRSATSLAAALARCSQLSTTSSRSLFLR